MLVGYLSICYAGLSYCNVVLSHVSCCSIPHGLVSEETIIILLFLFSFGFCLVLLLEGLIWDFFSLDFLLKTIDGG